MSERSREVGLEEARLAEQGRGAYMTGRVTGLAVMVQANDLRDLVERAVTLSYVISADQDVLSRLEVARKRAVQLHDGMVKAEKARVAAEATVRVQLGELERVRAVRQQAKRKMDARVAKLAGAAAALRSRSAELRHLIRQEELARQRAARGGGGGSIHGSGGAVTCRAPRRPSTGSSCASPAGSRPPTTRPRRRSGSASCCSATGSCTWARRTPPPTAAASCGRSGPMSATATAPPPGPRPSGRPTAGTDPPGG